MKTLLLLPDGREIFSGGPGAAVIHAAITRSVNDRTDLTPGAVIPARLQLTLVEADIAPGDRLTVFRVDETGARHPAGVFLVQSPIRRGAATLELTALDPMCLLDKDLTDWLAGLESWPYTLGRLAEMTCQACSVSLRSADFPNAHIPVGKFALRDVTGADILGWIAQLAGCFCQADDQGQVELAWYAPAPAPVTFPDTMTHAQCPVAPVERVLLRRDVSDVGIGWPDGGGNTCILSSPLLSAIGAEELQTIAQSLYERLAEMTYTPCTVAVPETAGMRPGQLLELPGGLFVPVMKTETENGRTRLTCTGNHLRDNTHSLRTVAGLRGKFLSIQAEVEGIRVENADSQGRLTDLQLDVEGLRTQVTHRRETEEGLEQRLSAVEQRAESVDITLRHVTQEGADRVVTRTGYSLTEQGLSIRRSGEPMESRLDHTGLAVTRDGQSLLRADHRGVEAVDVTVGNYLIVGDHARFEDYQTGTACYYI